jgi:hypothetical protein
VDKKGTVATHGHSTSSAYGWWQGRGWHGLGRELLTTDMVGPYGVPHTRQSARPKTGSLISIFSFSFFLLFLSFFFFHVFLLLIFFLKFIEMEQISKLKQIQMEQISNKNKFCKWIKF